MADERIEGEYVDIKVLRRLPYKSGLTRESEVKLAKYFDKRPYFAREWDVYFFEDRDDGKNIFLHPLEQVEAFLTYTHKQTGIQLRCPRPYNFPAEAMAYELEFVGVSTSEGDYDKMMEEYAIHDYATEKAENKAGGKNLNKAKKTEEKFRKQFVAGLRTCVLARRFLGFRDSMNKGDEAVRTLFVCVDVESYERGHKSILEIGIARLDTGDIPLDANGNPPSADEMFKLAEFKHYRILEFKHLRNGTFVADASDKFQFGESEWIHLKDAPKVIASNFRFKEPGVRGRVAFLGHDAKTDADYLRQLGYNVNNIAGLERFDTAQMYRAILGEANPRSLGTVCNDFDIIPWHLHNAGNDAAYTLQIFLKIAEGFDRRDFEHGDGNKRDLAREIGYVPSPMWPPLPVTQVPDATNQHLFQKKAAQGIQGNGGKGREGGSGWGEPDVGVEAGVQEWPAIGAATKTVISALVNSAQVKTTQKQTPAGSGQAQVQTQVQGQVQATATRNVVVPTQQEAAAATRTQAQAQAPPTATPAPKQVQNTPVQPQSQAQASRTQAATAPQAQVQAPPPNSPALRQAQNTPTQSQAQASRTQGANTPQRAPPTAPAAQVKPQAPTPQARAQGPPQSAPRGPSQASQAPPPTQPKGQPTPPQTSIPLSPPRGASSQPNGRQQPPGPTSPPRKSSALGSPPPAPRLLALFNQNLRGAAQQAAKAAETSLALPISPTSPTRGGGGVAIGSPPAQGLGAGLGVGLAQGLSENAAGRQQVTPAIPLGPGGRPPPALPLGRPRPAVPVPVPVPVPVGPRGAAASNPATATTVPPPPPGPALSKAATAAPKPNPPPPTPQAAPSPAPAPAAATTPARTIPQPPPTPATPGTSGGVALSQPPPISTPLNPASTSSASQSQPQAHSPSLSGRGRGNARRGGRGGRGGANAGGGGEAGEKDWGNRGRFDTQESQAQAQEQQNGVESRGGRGRGRGGMNGNSSRGGGGRGGAGGVRINENRNSNTQNLPAEASEQAFTAAADAVASNDNCNDFGSPTPSSHNSFDGTNSPGGTRGRGNRGRGRGVRGRGGGGGSFKDATLALRRDRDELAAAAAAAEKDKSRSRSSKASRGSGGGGGGSNRGNNSTSRGGGRQGSGGGGGGGSRRKKEAEDELPTWDNHDPNAGLDRDESEWTRSQRETSLEWSLGGGKGVGRGWGG